MKLLIVIFIVWVFAIYVILRYYKRDKDVMPDIPDLPGPYCKAGTRGYKNCDCYDCYIKRKVNNENL